MKKRPKLETTTHKNENLAIENYVFKKPQF